MARARNIKPSFFTNDKLGELPPLARLLFAGLWCVADREGRAEDRPKRIKAELLPYDVCDVEALLHALAVGGFIRRYAVNGQAIIQVINFARHQNPHLKEKASILPAPDNPGAIPVHVPESPVLAQDIPEKVGLIPDCGIPQPDSLDLIPDSRVLNPDGPRAAPPSAPQPSHLAAPRTARPPRIEMSVERRANAAAVWQAYGDAYFNRYGAAPVRNARINRMIQDLLDRLPADEAPAVAAFYLRSASAFYVAKGHPVGLLLADAEKLRTEWATGRSVTVTEARQQDHTQALGNAFGALIDERQGGRHG